MPNGRSPKARIWCFTLNAPNEVVYPEGRPDGSGVVPVEDGRGVVLPSDSAQQAWLLRPENLPMDWLDQDGVVRAGLVYQMERGAQGGCHWQGVVRFKEPRRLGGLKRWHQKVHWEQCRSPAASDSYCSDPGKRVEGDDPRLYVREGCIGKRGRGARNDLLEVKEKLDSGVCEEKIADEHFVSWLKHERAFKKYKQLKVRKRTHQTNCTVYWGDPGTGKSHRAFEESSAGGASVYYLEKPTSGTLWWDGYDGQDHVVIDEFNGWMPLTTLKRLIDKYVCLQGSDKARAFRDLTNSLYDVLFE